MVPKTKYAPEQREIVIGTNLRWYITWWYLTEYLKARKARFLVSAKKWITLDGAKT